MLDSLHDIQARDLPDVPDVAGHDSEAELHGGRGDEQIFEGDAHAMGSPIALFRRAGFTREFQRSSPRKDLPRFLRSLL